MSTSGKLDGKQADAYNGVVNQSEFELFSGKFALPVASNDPNEPAVVVVTAHLPYRRKTQNYVAQKEGAPPLLPMPADGGGMTFLGGSVAIPYPTLTMNAGYKWEVATQFTFVESGPINLVSDGYVLGSMPWVYANQVANAQSGGYVGENVPQSVANAGIGPRAGYSLSLQLDTNQAGWSYNEPSFLPGTLHSADLVTGSNSYPSL